MDRTSGAIIDPHTGEPALIDTVMFTTEEARLLREYKKLLLKYGLRESVFCNACWSGNISDGLDAAVTDNLIVFRCRCCQRVFNGPTY